MHRLGDPVDPWIAANLYYRSAENARRSEQTTCSFVAGVDEDDFVVLVHTVLVDPVRVEHTKVAAAPADALLCDALQTTLGLEVVDTLTDGLAVGGT